MSLNPRVHYIADCCGARFDRATERDYHVSNKVCEPKFPCKHCDAPFTRFNDRAIHHAGDPCPAFIAHQRGRILARLESNQSLGHEHATEMLQDALHHWPDQSMNTQPGPSHTSDSGNGPDDHHDENCCRDCFEPFTKAGILRQHIASKTCQGITGSKHRCPVCEKGFVTADGARKHIKNRACYALKVLFGRPAPKASVIQDDDATQVDASPGTAPKLNAPSSSSAKIRKTREQAVDPPPDPATGKYHCDRCKVFESDTYTALRNHQARKKACFRHGDFVCEECQGRYDNRRMVDGAVVKTSEWCVAMFAWKFRFTNFVAHMIIALGRSVEPGATAIGNIMHTWVEAHDVKENPRTLVMMILMRNMRLTTWSRKK